MTDLAYPSGVNPGQGVVGLRYLADLLAAAWHPDGGDNPGRDTADVVVRGLANHSAEVAAGQLFFAIPGTNDDGGRYAEAAVRRGAVAVVAESPLQLPLQPGGQPTPVLVVPDARIALAEAAATWFQHPSRAMPVVGVTGTNGKTTITHLLRDCLAADRRNAGLLGTIAYEFGGRRIPAPNTTPDPLRIHGYLRDMADRRADACVLEVSSHGLCQHRVRGVRFAAAVFSNLTQDHLDYHGTMRAYAEAKSRLFGMLEPGATACVCIDSPWAETMLDACDAGVEVMTFGCNPDADVRAENLSVGLSGTRFDLVMPNGRVELFLRLPGRHNVENALAAATAALSLGVSELTIAQALEDATPVAGRLETVGTAAGVRVLVDYAHTPDALQQVCGSLQEMTRGRLHTVFGCGGDRDRSKRGEMARAVARFSSRGVMTSDNPRSEDPERILDDMEAGLAEIPAGEPRAEFERVVHRAEAIRHAVATAEPGDTVLIAGKGHESYQIIGDSVEPFDDRLVAKEALAERELANRGRGSAERMRADRGLDLRATRQQRRAAAARGSAIVDALRQRGAANLGSKGVSAKGAGAGPPDPQEGNN